MKTNETIAKEQPQEDRATSQPLEKGQITLVLGAVDSPDGRKRWKIVGVETGERQKN